MVFQQSRPEGKQWSLVGAYDKRAGQLTFENAETGEAVTVPNIWYNQPVATRVDALRFYADRADSNARAQRGMGHPWSETEAQKAEQRASDLRICASRMEATQTVEA